MSYEISAAISLLLCYICLYALYGWGIGKRIETKMLWAHIEGRSSTRLVLCNLASKLLMIDLILAIIVAVFFPPSVFIVNLLVLTGARGFQALLLTSFEKGDYLRPLTVFKVVTLESSYLIPLTLFVVYPALRK
jgi:hypothetical protein